MKRAAMAAGLVAGSLLLGGGVWGQKAPLLPEKEVAAIALGSVC